MKKELTKYNISIDGGTASVGWAVTSMDGKLLKKSNKNLWGVNLFSEADTAAKRRMFRSTRRRYCRRKQRIKLLQDLMFPIVSTVDENFFKKLQCTYMDEEDRNDVAKIKFNSKCNVKNILFDVNENEEIKRFFKGYGNTIYHLRKYCMESDKAVDPRLLYLAMHHIIKYRGNFLYEGQELSFDNINDIKNKFNLLLNLIVEIYEDEIFANVSVADTIDILCDSKLSSSKKKEQIKSKTKLSKDESKIFDEIVKAILGYSFNANYILNIDSGKNNLIKLSDSDADEKVESLLDYHENSEEIFECLKSIYSFILLKNIMSDSVDGYYSSSMINIYDKHKKDLKLLKRLIRKNNDKKGYDKLFKKPENDKISNYEMYVHHPKKGNIDDFYKLIKSVISDYPNSKDKEDILIEIENKDFLPKQNLSSNFAVPYQFNKKELEKIIDNQGRFYPGLLENKDKIISILEFKIPYYVGPLVTNNYNNFSWVIRDTNRKLYPWNWQEIVNKDETAEKFIKRMTNHCTYLLAEDVLPKNSLIYTKYELLNELNKISINGNHISKDLKEDAIDNLFMKKSKITETDFKNFLINHQYYSQKDYMEISGYQKDKCFASSLVPWIKFKDIFGPDFENNFDCIEKIIEWITIYNDKSIIKHRIETEYPFISNEQIKRIISINYKGFGRLSRKLLYEIKGTGDIAENLSIVEVLESTNLNFMQIINNKKFGFSKQIDAENDENIYNTLNDEDIVSELMCSPKIKRCILQTIKIVKELRDYFGHDPENIFIEMARDEEEKKRTTSKTDKYRKIYEGILNQKDKSGYAFEVKKDSKLFALLDEDNLTDEKKLLYVLQQGKSMYSLKPIDIEHLEMCEVDHILPQSYIKDDSIENKALVLRGENQRKGDRLFLDENIINNCKQFWNYLLEHNLIGEKKYKNLTRRGVSQNEQIGFINRQLVETRQINKYVANILKKKYSSKIISVKASLSSEFRKRNNLYKLRILNDTHHAFDAYLASMIGLYMINKYPSMISTVAFDGYNKEDFQKNKELQEDLKERIEKYKNNPNYNFQSFIIEQLNDKPRINYYTGELIWNGKESLDYVKKVYNYKDYFITYKQEYGQSELYKQTLWPPTYKDLRNKIEGHGAYSANINRPFSKYGGYCSQNAAFGTVVSYKKRNKNIKKLVYIPANLYYASKETIIDFISKELKIENESIEIIKEKVYSGQLFVANNTMLYMSSPSEWRCKKQLFLDEKYYEIISKIENNVIDKINEEELNQLLSDVLNKTLIEKPILKDQIVKLKDYMPMYFKLPLNKKVEFVKTVLICCSAGGKNMDISKLIDIPEMRFTRLAKRTFDLDNTLFIYQSITGIYKKVKKL